MRLQFHSLAASAAAFIGLAAALSSFASPTQIDPASAVRGSLGVPIEDLMLSSSSGAVVFFLNAGFALLYAIFAIVISRSDPRKAAQVRVRATSNFAR